MVREQKRMKHRLLTEEVERSEYQLFIWTHIWVFVCYLHNMVKGTGRVEWRRWRQWISHSKCSREHIFLSLCALAPPYGQRDKEVVRRSLGEEDTRARWILRRRCDGDASFDALATSQKRLTTTHSYSNEISMNPNCQFVNNGLNKDLQGVMHSERFRNYVLTMNL